MGDHTVGDDGAGLGQDLELLGGELEHRGEGRRLRHAEPVRPPHDTHGLGRDLVRGGVGEGGRDGDLYSHFEGELGFGEGGGGGAWAAAA